MLVNNNKDSIVAQYTAMQTKLDTIITNIATAKTKTTDLNTTVTGNLTTLRTDVSAQMNLLNTNVLAQTNTSATAIDTQAATSDTAIKNKITPNTTDLNASLTGFVNNTDGVQIKIDNFEKVLMTKT